jgi:hypothetical protein
VAWKSEWDALSIRITSLLDAGHFFAEILKTNSSDIYSAAGLLADSACQIFRDLESFRQRHSEPLPRSAEDRLGHFVNAYKHHFEAAAQGRDNAVQAVHFRLTALRVLQSEIGYLIADTETAARSLVERAFLHLQRSIIADPSVRATWNAAFEDGETACEKLGAAHLLLHGIWGFKANAEGERTDLILGQRLQIDSEMQRASNALVLTEWKVAHATDEPSSKAREAFDQAKRYAESSLAGFELGSRRYLVIVSKRRLAMPPDLIENRVTYQHINVPVEPATPSVESRKPQKVKPG